MNLHGTYTIAPLEHARTRPLLCKAYAQTRLLLSCSRYTWSRTLQGIATHCGLSAKSSAEARIRFFRFGILPRTFQEKTGNTEKKILFVGELKPRKGIVEMIRACGEFRRRSQVPFRFDLVGAFREEQPYTQEIRAAIAQEKLEDCVHLQGHTPQEKLEDLYAHADLFLMLSKSEGVHYEGFGLVFLEAASYGIPVIGSRDSGCKEALDEGRTGYAMDHDDAKGIAERMRDILERETIKRADCRTWADTHTIAAQIERFEEIYKEALA